MRNLRYFIAFFILIFLSAPAFTASAQSKQQVDSMKVKLGGTVRTLSGLTGWIKDYKGRWISSPNRIPYEDPDFNNEYYDKYPIGTENLKSIQVRSLTITGKPYYMLVVNYIKGYEKEKKDAKGKVIETEWKNIPYLDYFVIPKEELKNLKPQTFTFGKPTFANVRFIYFGSFYNTSSALQEKRIKERIEYNVVSDHSKDTTMNSYFQFNLLPVSDKRGKNVKFNYSLVYAEKGQQPVLPDYGLFKAQYFEVPYTKWQIFSGK